MAGKKANFFDIWILDIQKVYRDVPYNVVVDWVQQGRLLEDDRLRPSGTADWTLVRDFLEVKPFLPHAEPHRADDQAEALEPVQLDFSYRKPIEDEDEDVDMIPLIDVSLVLLVFFMLTAAGGAAALNIPVPPIQFGSTVTTPEGIMLGIDLKDGVPVYSLSEGANPPAAEDRDLPSLAELLQRLDARFQASEIKQVVTINAHQDVKSGVVRDLTAKLEESGRKHRVNKKFIGVREESS